MSRAHNVHQDAVVASKQSHVGGEVLRTATTVTVRPETLFQFDGVIGSVRPSAHDALLQSRRDVFPARTLIGLVFKGHGRRHGDADLRRARELGFRT